MTTTIRTIIEEVDVSAEIDTWKTKFPRLEDAWEAWKWRLARGPEIDAQRLAGFNPPAWILKTNSAIGYYGIPTITILYRFDDNQVNILAVKIVEPTK
jgi:hypothetical protein